MSGAIVGESARWGDRRREPPYTRDVEWTRERRRLLTSYFPQRTGTLLAQLTQAGLYPKVAAPELSPEGGAIGLVREGDRIRIDIPNRTIAVLVDDTELEQRRSAMVARGPNAFKPERDRPVSPALVAYSLMTTSAAQGAVRDVTQLDGRG